MILPTLVGKVIEASGPAVHGIPGSCSLLLNLLGIHCSAAPAPSKCHHLYKLRSKGGKMPDWLEKAVFYEIYPQSFFDSNGDGIGALPHPEEIGISPILGVMPCGSTRASCHRSKMLAMT